MATHLMIKKTMTITSLAILVAVISVAATMTLVQATHPDEMECSSDTDGVVDNSGTPVICKTVDINEHGIDNGVIAVGESIEYVITIDVENASTVTWLGVTVKDRFAGNLAVGDGNPASFPTGQVDTIDAITNLDCDAASLTQKGKTAKEFLDCNFDDGDQDMEDGDTASVTVTAWTDFNHGQGKKTPVGKRSYTSCGPDQDVNSGATVSFTLADLSEHTFSTPSVTVDVFEFEDLAVSDCDGDGIFSNVDQCPFEPETVNGFEDADGCPDVAP